MRVLPDGYISFSIRRGAEEFLPAREEIRLVVFGGAKAGTKQKKRRGSLIGSGLRA